MEHPDIKTILHYCPEAGVFTWMARTSRRVQVGDVAGFLVGGRVGIRIKGVNHYAHRLAWLYMTGAWPSHVALTGALGEVVCGVLGLYVGGRVHLKGG